MDTVNWDDIDEKDLNSAYEGRPNKKIKALKPSDFYFNVQTDPDEPSRFYIPIQAKSFFDKHGHWNDIELQAIFEVMAPNLGYSELMESVFEPNDQTKTQIDIENELKAAGFIYKMDL